MTDYSTSTDRSIDKWLDVVRSEYRESPGLSLTMAQARRLWNLDELFGSALFGSLVDAGFLKPIKGGRFVRTG